MWPTVSSVQSGLADLKRMNSFTDYYAILGIEVDAPPSAIKTAFKKLALQYHPDVYKGDDAHERMRLLLLAYQTLNDPVARRQYDTRRSEHVPGSRLPRAVNIAGAPTRSATGRTRSEVTPGARRDRQRHYDFPDFRDGHPVHIDLIDMAYTLSSTEARTLIQQGMLRGVAPETEERALYCHRCHHTWNTGSSQREKSTLPRLCPKCRATDWSEYLLLRCLHCCAVFESEQIRYEVGTYTYGTRDPLSGAALCPPYELFPLCPYCGTARWCPAEDARVHELRERAARHAALLRMVWITVAVVVVVVVGAIVLGVLR